MYNITINHSQKVRERVGGGGGEAGNGMWVDGVGEGEWWYRRRRGKVEVER